MSNQLRTQDEIDSHARQARALAELLVDHYGGQEDHNVMNDDIMCSLMANLAGHMKRIMEINEGVQS